MTWQKIHLTIVEDGDVVELPDNLSILHTQQELGKLYIWWRTFEAPEEPEVGAIEPHEAFGIGRGAGGG